MPSPFDQERYQVRHETGAAGLARLAPADVVVVVDVLDAAEMPTDASAAAAASLSPAPLVLLGSLRNAAAVADRVAALQEERGRRTSVAVIACGERAGRGVDAAVRVAVEDQLGAGAVVAALGDRGIDHASPEAAFACEGFRALRGAVRHLLAASGSGQKLLAAGRADDVRAAATLDDLTAVPELRDGRFVVSAA